MNGGSGRALKILRIIKNLPVKKNFEGIFTSNTFSKKILFFSIQKLNLSFGKFKLLYS